MLFGETVAIDKREREWSKVRASRDGYTGWVETAALAPALAIPSHRIGQPSGLVFARRDIKSPVTRRLYYSSPLTLREAGDLFYELDDGGFIHRRQVVAQSFVEADPVAVALRFVGTPYLWGGRTFAGIDCSALVQTALLACGIACPRDTGDQRAAFGDFVVTDAYRRGDLVFFPGHVGIMIDAAQLLHANAFWMSTVVEPLAAVVVRLRRDIAVPVLAVVRLA